MNDKDFKARISAIVRGQEPTDEAALIYRPPIKLPSIYHKRGEHWKQLARVQTKGKEK